MSAAGVPRFTVAALVFTTREKDYGGIHLGISAVAATALCELLASRAFSVPGRARRLAVDRNSAVLAKGIFPRGQFLTLTSLQLQGSDRVCIAVEARAGLVELTAAAARAASEHVAMAHATGGDACIVGDSHAWTDRLWIWPL